MPYKEAASIGLSEPRKKELEDIMELKGWQDKFDSWDEAFQEVIRLIELYG